MKIFAGRVSDGMNQKIEPPPSFLNALKERLHLARLLNIKRKNEISTYLLGERPDMALSLFVEVSDCQFSAECP